MKTTLISWNAKPATEAVSARAGGANPMKFDRDYATRQPVKTPPPRLTPRQLEVLSLLCEGLPNKLICRQLNIATGTVKVHISCILRELGVASRLQAVVAARRCGVLGDFGEAAQAQAHQSMPEESLMRLRMLLSSRSAGSQQGAES